MSAALLTEWARLLLGTLARAGIEDVVLSPGSRSTPFAWAALNEPQLRCHSLVDERVAAFFALGQARATGKPSLLVCTSGTAAANYYPAVIEASLSRLPLLILTADRPFELQHSAAPQAIDQIKLFGESVRAFFELGAPDAAASAFQGVVRSVAHAVQAARFPEPGPVHLNARARKPLEPVVGEDPASSALRERVDQLLARGPTLAAGATLQGDVRRMARACETTARGVIMVGPHQPEDAAPAVARLAEVTGFPVFCEATSQLRWTPERTPGARLIDGFDWLLRCERLRGELGPDLILSFGATPTSGAYERLLSGNFAGQRFVVAPHGFPDPHGLASELISAESERAAQATLALLEQSGVQEAGARQAFGRAWSDANAQAWSAVETELARPALLLREPRAVRAVLNALPSPCTLVLGNSLPIRDVDAYVPASTRSVRVLSQRGANGIDGLISGAAGAASRSREPTVLLLGDVSFMHDLGGLAAARAQEGPFAIVIIDNGGGRIFEQLPIFAQLQSNAEAARFWLTPPAVDFEHAARLFRYRYARVTEEGEITNALQRATSELAVSIVHIVVEGASARESELRIRAALEHPPGTERVTLLLALHGFTGSPRSWDFLAGRQAMPRVVPALVGHSGSDAGPEINGFEAEVDRLAALAPEGGVHLVGYSLGARLALGIALRHPARVKRLTLLSCHPGLHTQAERQARRASDEAWCDILLTRGVAAFVDAWQAQPLWATQIQLPHATRQRRQSERLSHTAKGLALSLRATGLGEMPDYGARLAELRLPVTVLAGALDEKFSALARHMAERIPHADLEIVEGAGHDLLLEKPELVNEVIRRGNQT